MKIYGILKSGSYSFRSPEYIAFVTSKKKAIEYLKACYIADEAREISGHSGREIGDWRATWYHNEKDLFNKKTLCDTTFVTRGSIWYYVDEIETE